MLVLLQIAAYLEDKIGHKAHLEMIIFFVFVLGLVQIPIFLLSESVDESKIAIICSPLVVMGLLGLLFGHWVLYLDVIGCDFWNLDH